MTRDGGGFISVSARSNMAMGSCDVGYQRAYMEERVARVLQGQKRGSGKSNPAENGVEPDLVASVCVLLGPEKKKGRKPRRCHMDPTRQ